MSCHKAPHIWKRNPKYTLCKYKRLLVSFPLLPNHSFVFFLRNTPLERGFSWGKQRGKKRILVTIKVLQKHLDLKEIKSWLLPTSRKLLGFCFCFKGNEWEFTAFFKVQFRHRWWEVCERVKAPHYGVVGHFTNIFQTITTSVRWDWQAPLQHTQEMSH